MTIHMYEQDKIFALGEVFTTEGEMNKCGFALKSNKIVVHNMTYGSSWHRCGDFNSEHEALRAIGKESNYKVMAALNGYSDVYKKIIIEHYIKTGQILRGLRY